MAKFGCPWMVILLNSYNLTVNSAFEPQIYASSKGSNQTVHLCSLIRIFTVTWSCHGFLVVYRLLAKTGQTAQVCKLIRVFTGCTCPNAHILMLWVIFVCIIFIFAGISHRCRFILRPMLPSGVTMSSNRKFASTSPLPAQWLSGRASALWPGGCGFDPRPGHTKDFKNGTSCSFAWRSALRK